MQASGVPGGGVGVGVGVGFGVVPVPPAHCASHCWRTESHAVVCEPQEVVKQVSSQVWFVAHATEHLR